MGAPPTLYEIKATCSSTKTKFDPPGCCDQKNMGGTHIWRSRKALHPCGKVVAYDLTGSLRGRLASGRSGSRDRFRAVLIFGLYIVGSWLLLGRKRAVPYSIQWLKRLKPELFKEDLMVLFGP